MSHYQENPPLPLWVSLLYIQTITHSYMCWQRRNMMPLSSDGLLLWVGNFKILYRSRKAKADVDGLSRLPHRSENYSSIPDGVLNALCQRQECINTSKQVVEDADIFKETNNQDWWQHQMEDSITNLFLSPRRIFPGFVWGQWSQCFFFSNDWLYTEAFCIATIWRMVRINFSWYYLSSSGP